MSVFYDINFPIAGYLIESPRNIFQNPNNQVFTIKTDDATRSFVWAPAPYHVTSRNIGSHEDILVMRLFNLNFYIQLVLNFRKDARVLRAQQPDNSSGKFQRGQQILRYYGVESVVKTATVSFRNTGPISVALSVPVDKDVQPDYTNMLIRFKLLGEGDDDPENDDLVAKGWNVSEFPN